MDESELRVVKAESPATNCAPSPGVASACPIQYLVRFAAEVRWAYFALREVEKPHNPPT